MLKRSIKKIGVLTSGGDGPGMNAAVRSVVRMALHCRLEVVGIIRGFSGLINADLIPLDHRAVSNIIGHGGTIIKTSRCPEFIKASGQKKAAKVIKDNAIDAIVGIGGDGTYRGLVVLQEKWGVPCIGLPGTIDNDLNGTESTIGSDTAVNTALEAIDKIRDTATSLERIFVVEVMGRECGYIAARAALAGGAEQVLLPHKNIDINKISRQIKAGRECGKNSWIIIVAEGAASGETIGRLITRQTRLETRVTVLGHIQRGGVPTANDRILATRLGAEAVRLLKKGVSNKAVGIRGEEITAVDLRFACSRKIFDSREYLSLIKILT